MYLAAVLGLALLVLALPPAAAGLLAFSLLVASALTAWIARRGQVPAWLPPAVEIALVVLAALLASYEFLIDDPTQTLGGSEVEWQVVSGYMASVSLREQGYITLWNPWLEFGHPAVDNALAFVLNPFSTLPALIWGGVRGIKLGVVTAAVLAGVGGWFLGWVLELGAPARVLLGLLLIGKGNMHAMIGAGYYQLGGSQAYFPWLVAGIVAIVRRPGARWPPVLAALAYTLLLWAGNVWYSFPMAINGVLLGLAYVLFADGRRVDWRRLGRLAFAAVLAVGLSAVYLLPVAANIAYLGDHPDHKPGYFAVDIMRLIEQYYNGDMSLYREGIVPGDPQFYYSFVAPVWFLFLLFVTVPYVPRRRRGMGRLWAVGVFMIVFCTLWATDASPIFHWLYRNVPPFGQWRFMGRALAVGAFWIAILAACRFDDLWAVLVRSWRRWGVRLALAAALLAAGEFAAYEVISKWRELATPASLDQWALDRMCVTWLRERYPEAELSIYKRGYYRGIFSYIDNRVRYFDIGADFDPLPLASTIGSADLTRSLPPYAVAWVDEDREWLAEHGYERVPESPNPVDEHNCLWYKADALSYAYRLPVPVLKLATDPELLVPLAEPVETFERGLDLIALWVQAPPRGEEPHVLTIQEEAYPGWEVLLDGRPARLESVGGQVGLVLPSDGEAHTVVFRYRPRLFYIGGVVTLLAAAGVALYLLRAERRLPLRWRRWRGVWWGRRRR